MIYILEWLAPTQLRQRVGSRRRTGLSTRPVGSGDPSYVTKIVVPLIIALLAAAPTDARAQYPAGGANRFGSQQVPGPFGRPTVSPYINLLRSNSPVLDYYGLVRPEVDAYQANVRLETSLNQLETQFRNQQRLPQTANSQLTPTGRASAFMTDIHGRPESIPQDMRTRQLLLEAEAARTGRTVAPSGHAALFGNRGFYYRQGLTP